MLFFGRWLRGWRRQISDTLDSPMPCPEVYLESFSRNLAMYRITIRIRFEPEFLLALFLMLLCFGGLAASSAAAEPHVLRASGRTLIEAEKYSSASTKHPRTESSPWCSGQANLAYFRRDKWFELKMEVPRMLNYSISLRASSPAGTQIEIQRDHRHRNDIACHDQRTSGGFMGRLCGYRQRGRFLAIRNVHAEILESP